MALDQTKLRDLLRAAFKSSSDAPSDSTELISPVLCFNVSSVLERWISSGNVGVLTVGAILGSPALPAALHTHAFQGWGVSLALYFDSIIWKPAGNLISVVPPSNALIVGQLFQTAVDSIVAAGPSERFKSVDDFADEFSDLIHTYAMSLIFNVAVVGSPTLVPIPIF